MTKRVFRLEWTYGRYRWLAPANKADWRKILDYKEHPSRGWVPIEVAWLAEDESRKISDFPYFEPVVRAFSQRARDALAEYLIPNGVFLPLLGLSGKYIGYRVTSTVDALDKTMSDVQVESGKVREIRRAVLDVSKVGDASVFGIPDLRTAVFVSHDFRKRVEANGLTGFHFEETGAVSAAGTVIH